MRKNLSLLSAFILTFSFSTHAEPIFNGKVADATANVIVEQDSDVFINVGNPGATASADEVANAVLFSFTVGADSNTKVSLSGFNETKIQSDGTVLSNDMQGTRLIAALPDAYKNLTPDVAYFPDRAKTHYTEGAHAVLLADSDSYSFLVRGANVEQNVLAGQYVFDFVAQAYTE